MKPRFYLFLCFYLLLLGEASAQESNLNFVNSSSALGSSQIQSTNDGGYAVLQTDSAILFRFKPCGALLWAKKYNLPDTGIFNRSFGFIVPKSGGFLFISSANIGGRYHQVLTRLNDEGEIVYSKRIGDDVYYQFPYSVAEDRFGNFWVHGYAANGQPTKGSIIKFDANGVLLWSKLYGQGGWGGATPTSDGGCLFRSWSAFVKLNSSGDIEWSVRDYSNFLFGFYGLNHSIEVEDGYILNQANRIGTASEFVKIDFNGNISPLGVKKFPFYIGPTIHYKKENGHIFTFFYREINSVFYSGLLEFDANFNQIKYTCFKGAENTGRFYPRSLTMSPDGSLLLSGKYGDLFSSGKMAILKSIPSLPSACDTLLSLSHDTTYTMPAVAFATSMESHNWSVFPYDLPQPIDFSVTVERACPARFPTLSLGNDTSLCVNTSIVLRPEIPLGFEPLLWSTGEVSQAIEIKTPGNYWFQVIDRCFGDTLTDSIQIGFTGTECEELEMPNWFSPNNDQKNDLFSPIAFRGIEEADMTIFNRWGEKIFLTKDLIQAAWDGEDLVDGVYFWVINYRTKSGKVYRKSGIITLQYGF